MNYTFRFKYGQTVKVLDYDEPRKWHYGAVVLDRRLAEEFDLDRRDQTLDATLVEYYNVAIRRVDDKLQSCEFLGTDLEAYDAQGDNNAAAHD